jgi:hypothetical protein
MPTRVCQSHAMHTRTYRLEVEGELSEEIGSVFEGMHLMRDRGNTLLEGPVQDQAALQGLLQRCSDLGLTLVGVNVVERSPEE